MAETLTTEERDLRRALRGLTPTGHTVLTAVVTGRWEPVHALVSAKRLDARLQGLERRGLVYQGGDRRWYVTALGRIVAGRPAPASRERTGNRG